MGTPRFGLILAILLFERFLLPEVAYPGPPDHLRNWTKEPGKCPHGLHRQPAGPFAVFLFCEDALGTYLGVLYSDPIGAPVAAPFVNAWTLENRYWQDPVWSADVTGFVWNSKGSRLYVSTSEIYGSGGIFELDLPSRHARQLAPPGGASPVSPSSPGPGYVITRLDEQAGVLHYSPGHRTVVLDHE